MRDKMADGAKKIINTCLGVKAGENVLIITDYDISAYIALALKEAAITKGAHASILTVEQAAKPGEEPSSLMRAAMLESDVIIAVTSKTIMHSNAATQASIKGARIFTITECVEQTLISGAIEADFEKLVPVFDKLLRTFGNAEELHVTSPGGTDINLSLSGRDGHACSGICRTAGEKMGFPDAEFYIAPVEEKTNGIIVIDASCSSIGLVKEPIELQVKGGKIINITGGSEAEKLKKILNDSQNDGSYIVAEFAFGLNYKAKVVGNIIEDEGVYGTGHFALGNNLHFGGKNYSPIHIDMVYWKPTIELDGKILMKNGKLIDPYRIIEELL